MLKLNLRICADTLSSIRKILRQLSEERLQSNCLCIDSLGTYDYEFVVSNDIFSDDTDSLVVDPHTEQPI